MKNETMQAYQRDVVLVRVGVSEGAMVDDQGPGQGDKAAGDGNGKQGELEVGIHLGIGGGIKPWISLHGMTTGF